MGNLDLSCWHFILVAVIVYLGISLYTNSLDIHSLGAFNISLQIGTLTIFIIQLMLALDNYRQQAVERSKAFYQRYASLAQMKMNDIDKMFFGTPLLNRLYYQMYRSDPHIRLASKLEKNSKGTKDSERPCHGAMGYHEIIKAEHHAASIIFQTMADIYMTGLAEKDGQFYCEDLIEWWNTFRKWMGSPILQSHWKTLKDEHHPKFQQFMENIIMTIKK